jgi:hypothetical protein
MKLPRSVFAVTNGSRSRLWTDVGKSPRVVAVRTGGGASAIASFNGIVPPESFEVEASAVPPGAEECPQPARSPMPSVRSARFMA